MKKDKQKVNNIYMRRFGKSGNVYLMMSCNTYRGIELHSVVNCAFNLDYFDAKTMVSLQESA